ncbi:C-terminal binding protein [Candidatus Bipolaricaulota bacterium]
MSKWNVVITDYEYPNVEIERTILESADAVVHDHQCKNERDVIDVVAQADVVINQYAPITRHVIENLSPSCLAIGQYGIGVDTIDVAAATEHGIVVINVPSYCEDDVAEHAIAMMLALARRIPFYDREVRRSIWDYTTQAPIYRVQNRTLGLIGFGRIARKVAEKLRGFSLRILAYDPLVDPEIMLKAGVQPASLDELLEGSDFVSVHVPLNEQTRHLLGEKELQRLKPTAILVNVSRGPVIDQEALYRHLSERRIRAAGLDVFHDEPPTEKFNGHDLLSLDNAAFSPHVAWYSEESIVDLRRKLATDIARVLQGLDPEGFVNPEVQDRRRTRME